MPSLTAPVLEQADRRFDQMTGRVVEMERRLNILDQGVMAIKTQADQKVDEIIMKQQTEEVRVGVVEQEIVKHMADMTQKMTTADLNVMNMIQQLRGEVSRLDLGLKQAQGQIATNGSSTGGGSGGFKGFLPWKHMTPNRFGGKEEHWREWLEEVRGYIESTRPGMKALLLALERESRDLLTNMGFTT